MSQIVNKTGGVEIEGVLYFGIDAENMLKQQAKFDFKLEAELWKWLREALNEPLQGKDLGEALKDGKALCRLVNRIQPGTIKKINKKDIALMHMENIKLYLDACWNFGIPSSNLFTTTDLYRRRALTEVLRNLEAVARFATALPNWDGPKWHGPKVSRRSESDKKWPTVTIKPNVFIQDTESQENVDYRSEIVKLQQQLARIEFERDELLNEKQQWQTTKIVKASPKGKKKKRDKEKQDKSSSSSSNSGSDKKNDAGANDARLLSQLDELKEQLRIAESEKKALQQQHKRHQQTLLKYWEDQRELQAELANVTKQLEAARAQLQSRDTTTVNNTDTISSPTLTESASQRARQVFGLDSNDASTTDTKRQTSRFLRQLRGCTVELMTSTVARRDELPLSPRSLDDANDSSSEPVPNIDPMRVQLTARILETEVGRRAFSKTLKKTLYESPYLNLRDDAFEMMLYLFNKTLQCIDVDKEKDFIGARTIMQAATMIHRSVGTEPEFIHEYVHQYEIWSHLSFWEDLFWDELIQKHKARHAFDDDDNDDDEGEYALDSHVTAMLLEFSVNRMVHWRRPLAFIQQFVARIVEQTKLSAPQVQKLKDSIVAMMLQAQN